ncbi:lisH domain and HEAT repeat-containing protein KIAA1468 homolog isoform X3 [Myotis lucifugus]|uniref:lisH domain and HEAT repeat-containing protein KIAA1468 homolog isoform X3 n=1 Tax=Myotis lucifugus TaxID=59463 RepID=UPI000CCBE67E|nr:lisH domain and HEAT repeat-containing protein KIAA1468 homolog isoform X3 [Myotis lucifugus]
MAAMVPGGGGSGSGGVNPFLSDSDEDDDEVATTEERRAGLRLGSGGDLDPGSADSLSPQDPVALGSSARPVLPGEAAAAVALGGSGEHPARLSIDAIAAQLLRDQYLLTALELHTELLESGRELPRLRDYFSNPGNFERQSGTPPGMGAPGIPGAVGIGGAGGREPSMTSGGGQLNRAGSISTLDSLDFARYSDDGNRETDERVAVLEFELRKAKETIQALRANLTKAAEHEVPLQERKNYKSSPEIQEPIKPLEKRALNFLVNEFLLKNNYKLTSITFSDENDDQDFELWDDVGLNIPKPPDLLQLYRDFGNHQVSGKDLVDVASGVEEDELEALTPVLGNLPPPLETPQTVENSLLVQKLEDKISLLNSEKWSLMEQIRRLESEMHFLKNEHFAIPVICDSVQPSSDQSLHKDSEDSGQKPVTNSSDEGKNKDIHPSTSDEVDSTIPKENFPNSLPRREREGMPSSSSSSKNTVHFDKPNRKLSPAFHQALLSFCRMSADSRLGSEVSRIADSEQSVMLMLGRCLPHIVPNVLLAKREELIPLILCTACLHPEPKERDQLLHILFNLIKRPDDEQRQMILTGCVAFARHVGPTRVEAELLPQCWEQINHKYPERRLLVAESCGALAPYLPEGEHGLDEHKLHMYLSALQSLIPSLFAFVLQNAPFSSKAKLHGEVPQIEVTRFPRPMSPLQDVSTIIGSREQLAVLLQLYDYQLEHEGTTGWESLLWVVNQLLPQLIEIVGKINVTSTACVHEFSRFFWRLCRTFGKIFTNTKVKPQFQEILRLSEENIDSSAGNGVLTKATVPIYATGVLTCYIQEEDRKLLVGFLEDVMTLLSLSHAPLDSLKASFVELGANPAYHELLLTVLWYGVVHTSALVRCTAARMFELLVKGVNETLVAQRVVPALITLSSDPEISVRIATIPAFGTIMETVIQRELLERVKMQLASFLEDPQYQDQYSLHIEIIKTFGRVGPNAEPRFRDEFVIPHLHKLALVNNLQIVDSKRLDIATHLFEAYSALSCCFISEDLMVNHFLPGLRCLRTDMEHLSPEHEVILSSMIKECEQKVENKTVQEPQGSMSIAASLVSEDTKTKFLNKMGQLTTSGAMLANVFQRKK